MSRVCEGHRYESEEAHIDILRIGDEAERSQRQRLAELRARRDSARVESALAALEQAAEQELNVIEPMLECVRAYCTLHEIRHALENVYSGYREPLFF